MPKQRPIFIKIKAIFQAKTCSTSLNIGTSFPLMRDEDFGSSFLEMEASSLEFSYSWLSSSLRFPLITLCISRLVLWAWLSGLCCCRFFFFCVGVAFYQSSDFSISDNFLLSSKIFMDISPSLSLSVSSSRVIGQLLVFILLSIMSIYLEKEEIPSYYSIKSPKASQILNLGHISRSVQFTYFMLTNSSVVVYLIIFSNF